MSERHYVSHEVVQEFQPFKEDDRSIISTIYDWIFDEVTEELTEDQLKELRLKRTKSRNGLDGTRN